MAKVEKSNKGNAILKATTRYNQATASHQNALQNPHFENHTLHYPMSATGHLRRFRLSAIPSAMPLISTVSSLAPPNGSRQAVNWRQALSRSPAAMCRYRLS
jgi:hypothetical protein